MYGQFFGSYLLNRKAVTADQLTVAISNMGNSHIKLGTLAMYKGYMTSEEVDECCYIQRREDKRFGEIALERNYLFKDQLDDLLESQIPDYLRLGQILVDSGVITNAQLHDLMVGYNNENKYGNHSDADENNKMGATSLAEIKNYFKYGYDKEISEHTITYMHHLLNNLVRFIGDDFTPLEPVSVTEYDTHYCIKQSVNGPLSFVTRIDMDPEAAITFASRYAEMEFDEFDDYVTASMEDFLNLHNGLFCVNLSNVYSTELSLDAPVHEESPEIKLSEDSIILPVIYPFGTIFIILSKI